MIRMTMSDSPLKRRKTRGTFAVKPKKGTPSPSVHQASQFSAMAAQLTLQCLVTWPATQIPVEIFSLIISYLPRSNIQNMRLVNREFEEKVSEYLFRVVVVPFKPEIYGITEEPALRGVAELSANDAVKGSIMLQDKGMRVFQGYVNIFPIHLTFRC